MLRALRSCRSCWGSRDLATEREGGSSLCLSVTFLGRCTNRYFRKKSASVADNGLSQCRQNRAWQGLSDFGTLTSLYKVPHWQRKSMGGPPSIGKKICDPLRSMQVILSFNRHVGWANFDRFVSAGPSASWRPNEPRHGSAEALFIGDRQRMGFYCIN